MSPIIHIRKNVLGLTQDELARLCGTTQATVSRWESGDLSPSLNELAVIRAEARRLRRKWNDSLLFKSPGATA